MVHVIPWGIDHLISVTTAGGLTALATFTSIKGGQERRDEDYEIKRRSFLDILYLEIQRHVAREECCWHQQGCRNAKGERRLGDSAMKVIETLRHYRNVGNITVTERETLEAYELWLSRDKSRKGEPDLPELPGIDATQPLTRNRRRGRPPKAETIALED